MGFGMLRRHPKKEVVEKEVAAVEQEDVVDSESVEPDEKVSRVKKEKLKKQE
jgi:hypothetical protein